MVKDIEQKQQQIKEKMNKALDSYFKSFAEAGQENKLTIDEIEKIWGEAIKESQEILREATEEMTQNIGDIGEKKNVRPVEKH